MIVNKWTSFKRQLNIYGFKTIPCGQFQGCFTHPDFSQANTDKMPERLIPKKNEILCFRCDRHLTLKAIQANQCVCCLKTYFCECLKSEHNCLNDIFDSVEDFET